MSAKVVMLLPVAVQASLRLLRQFQSRARRFTEGVDSIKAVLLKDWGKHNNVMNTDPKERHSLSLGLLPKPVRIQSGRHGGNNMSGRHSVSLL